MGPAASRPSNLRAFRDASDVSGKATFVRLLSRWGPQLGFSASDTPLRTRIGPMARGSCFSSQASVSAALARTLARRAKAAVWQPVAPSVVVSMRAALGAPGGPLSLTADAREATATARTEGVEAPAGIGRASHAKRPLRRALPWAPVRPGFGADSNFVPAGSRPQYRARGQGGVPPGRLQQPNMTEDRDRV